MAVPVKTRRFTVDEYHRMARAGILGEGDRVELVDGQIALMAPRSRGERLSGYPHGSS